MATLPNTLRGTMYCREGEKATEFAIGLGLRAWAVERTGEYRHRAVTAIVFGKSRSDALRRASAPARLAEEMHNDVTTAVEIMSGWDSPVVWPIVH